MKTLALLALLAVAVSSTFAADPAGSSAVPVAGLPDVNHLVYLRELPESADLMKNAAANGLTITRLDRTSDRVVITYTYPDGSIATLGYALLSSAGNADRVTARRTTTEVTREPEIIYVDRSYPTRVVYRDPVDNFWLPLTLGLGLGWVTSHHGHHGHYRGGWYGHGHGGRRR